MKRDTNLHPLSWDHHAALTAAVLVRRQLDADADETTLTRIAGEFVTFHAEALVPHFRHEEEWLLPAFLAHVDESDAMIARLLRDHVALHAMIGRLPHIEPTRSALAKALFALVERLQAHVRFEERELFPRIESALSAEELTSVGERLYESKMVPVAIPGGDGQRVSPGPEPPLPEVDLD